MKDRGHGTLSQLLSFEDFEAAARRRLPRAIFTFLQAGSEDQVSARWNRAAFERWAIVPKVLKNVQVRKMSRTLFGTQWSAPFGIAPMGAAALCRFEADLELARAAHASNVPFVLSGASTVPLEKVMSEAPNTWFQAYLGADRSRSEGMIERLVIAGVQTLVVTVDVPVASNREAEVRQGFRMPPSVSARLALDGLAHPHWLLSTFFRTALHGGSPRFENAQVGRGAPMLSRRPSGLQRGDRAALDWPDIAWLRDRWRGQLVIKGVLHPQDAVRAAQIGCDGVIVSNHGGRQLDHAISPMHVLPEIVASTQGRIVVMIDSGFRRGVDIVKATALGAAFVFIGRPAMYACAISGQSGVELALTRLARELDIALALCGCASLSELTADCVRELAH